MKNLITLVCNLSFLVLAGCAPSQIPSGASPEIELKNGIVWYWEREAAGGCVSWMAKEQWASVRVLVDTGCVERGSDEFRSAKGLSYSSTIDESTFYGYWSWPLNASSDYDIFDEAGNWIGTRPCPHSLAVNQIERLSEIVDAGNTLSATAEETAMLDRLGERLAALDGNALSVSQFGCSDRPSDPEKKAELGKLNPWNPK